MVRKSNGTEDNTIAADTLGPRFKSGHTNYYMTGNCLFMKVPEMILTCHNVLVSVLVQVVRVLRVLSGVLLQTAVGSDLLILLAEADILDAKEQVCQRI